MVDKHIICKGDLSAGNVYGFIQQTPGIEIERIIETPRFNTKRFGKSPVDDPSWVGEKHARSYNFRLSGDESLLAQAQEISQLTTCTDFYRPVQPTHVQDGYRAIAQSSDPKHRTR